ncbi:uncharacterized protein KY384_007197 [Bacidia gigantensis]|uniref:uncharacterized protein n=1 Tax=Bacidia gigantensis TaxID=2732470 RepID=UPI001D04CFF1|nr:uncharacterized protein KY384_007197 [Bacidia gigantensis]KAG8528280.1 hypothetical protein KY384_007197 [Bacidia gigantensis]
MEQVHISRLVLLISFSAFLLVAPQHLDNQTIQGIGQTIPAADFQCRYSYDTDLLPELDIYLDTIQVMSAAAMSDYNQAFPPEAAVFNNVQLAYNGVTRASSVFQATLLSGLYRQLEEFAKARRFLALRSTCFRGSETLENFSYSVFQTSVGRNQSQGVSDALPNATKSLAINTSGSSNPACFSIGENSKRPVCFKYQLFSSPVSHGDYFKSIAGLLLDVAPEDNTEPVNRVATNDLNGITTEIRRNEARGYLPATLIWEDTIKMLYWAAGATVHNPSFTGDGFQEILVAAFYQVGSQALWIGDLQMRRFGEAVVLGDNISAATSFAAPASVA